MLQHSSQPKSITLSYMEGNHSTKAKVGISQRVVFLAFNNVRKLPTSPACNCIDCIQGVTPSRTYILLLLLGQNRN
ncbi:hypothetical protein HYC85_027956 [Camellia sinensis]|uniref:Uncharacterized protein n=1 Tax=Camellia sinensis TaxID=4442 RepID=A0A7J7FTU9_CAMSI|nr:hypothetical protein HYC85_027956 [Camellia sinensis]